MGAWAERWRLRAQLSPEQAEAFEGERRTAEYERGPRNALIAAPLHIAFGAADPVLVPDVLGLALVLRLVTAALIVLALPVSAALHRSGRPAACEVVKAAVGVSVLAYVGVIQMASSAPGSVVYFCGAFPVMTYLALTLRIRLPLAVGTLAVMSASVILSVQVGTVFSDAVARQVSSVLLATAVILAVMVMRREADERRSFLLRSQMAGLVAERDAGLAALTRANADLARLAGIDELTRIPNRRALTAQLHDWDAAGAWGAVAMLDVDHFKAFNDVHGHATGDACLRAVASRIADAVQVGDGFVARYGGEEFTVLLPSHDPDTAAAALERVRAAVAAVDVGGLGVTISIGWAYAEPGSAAGSALLLERADAAVLAAKAAGRDCVVSWLSAGLQLPPPVGSGQSSSSTQSSVRCTALPHLR